MPKIKLNIMTLAVTVTTLVSVGMVVKGAMYQPEISANKRKTDEIRQNIEYENQRIREIDEDMKRVGTLEYTEEVAREKLGMVGEGETIFIDMSVQE